MDQARRNSKPIVDAYVAAKEIKCIAACTDSRHFDPVFLYEKATALPEPPDARERRFPARCLILAGHAILTHARPELAGEVFEKAFLLLSDSKSGTLRSKAMAGVLLSWERMGHPRSGAAFINRALKSIEDSQGEKAKLRQEKRLSKAIEKAKEVKLPKVIKAPTGDYMPRKPKKRAHSSTLLKKSSS